MMFSVNMFFARRAPLKSSFLLPHKDQESRSLPSKRERDILWSVIFPSSLNMLVYRLIARKPCILHLRVEIVIPGPE